MLEQKLDEKKQKFLTQAIFEDQESLLQSIDLAQKPGLITKTDVVANDRSFISRFADLLHESRYFKLD